MLKSSLKNLRPVGDRVLLKFSIIKTEEKTAGGIILPDGSSEQMVATIIAVGEKVKMDEVQWKVGDKVLYNDFDLKKIEDTNGDGYGIIRYDNIWGVFD